MFRNLLRRFFHFRRRWQKPPEVPPSPADPRVDSDPWLAPLFAVLGPRYRLGDAAESGFQVLCRTGKARFNPMPVFLQANNRQVSGDYEMRVHDEGHLARGRALLDDAVGGQLSALGLVPVKETVENWAGLVIARRYQGTCADPAAAAKAVIFMCQDSEQVMDAGAQ